MRQPLAALGTAALLGLLATACSSSGTVPSQDATPAPAVSQTATSVAPAPTLAKPKTAEAIIRAIATLKDEKAPAKLTVVYDENTDQNHMLGRPGKYTSKASFTDHRIAASEANDTSAGAVDLGGSVEYFQAKEQAVARAKYIQSALNSVPGLGTEYDFVSDSGVLLRVSGVLPPSKANAYKDALTQVTGTQVTTVS